MNTYPHGPEAVDLLEVQRGVVGIRLQESKSAICEGLDVFRKGAVRTPEVRSGLVDHKSVERPDS